MPIFFGIILGFILSGFGQMLLGLFIDEKHSVELLDKMGFANIRVVDKASFWVSIRGCAIEDVVRFKITATSIKGQTVTLETCEGIFTDSVLRN